MSCKACASECPSNVDVATLKAEFEYQYQKSNGASIRTKLFAHTTRVNKIGAKAPSLYNYLLRHSGTITKRILNIAPNRSLPPLDVFKSLVTENNCNPTIKPVILYIDEFSEYLDGSIANDALALLEQLHYKVTILKSLESGRSYISKGFLKEAKQLANKNIGIINSLSDSSAAIVGIEPSAILTFRDEYLRLADDLEGAKAISKRSFLIEEFLNNEIALGNIKSEQFSAQAKKIKIHAHCHQKALSSVSPTFKILNLPVNFTPTIIPSGCCGMAGSFGYEKEHYEISMKVGEQTLFPAIRKADPNTIIVANGTSCRHQIKDGTHITALHPVTVLKEALL